jgi:hypothetical protein
MKSFLKTIVCFLCCMLMFTGHTSADPTSTAVTDVRVNESISGSVENSSMTRVESRSRNAAVKIETPYGYGSGTYVKIGDHSVVITAAHVVDSSPIVFVVGRSGERLPGSIVFVDSENDFAVVATGDLETRESVRFRPYRRDSSRLIGENISYTGFPNHHDLMTIRGSVAGIERGYIILQSYSWMGASGSGIFDDRGSFVGVLSAVDLGRVRGSYQIVSSVVWIVPITSIDLGSLETHLDSVL